jgi:hypothetical protein
MITSSQLATKIAGLILIQALEAFLALQSGSRHFYGAAIFFAAGTLLTTRILRQTLNKWRTIR